MRVPWTLCNNWRSGHWGRTAHQPKSWILTFCFNLKKISEIDFNQLHLIKLVERYNQWMNWKWRVILVLRWQPCMWESALFYFWFINFAVFLSWPFHFHEINETYRSPATWPERSRSLNVHEAPHHRATVVKPRPPVQVIMVGGL